MTSPLLHYASSLDTDDSDPARPASVGLAGPRPYWRHPLAIAAGVVLVAVVVAVAGGLASGPAAGPLRPVEIVNSFGFPVDAGQTFSFVIWHRSQQPASATLRSVELAGADSGLTLVGSGIGPASLAEPFVGHFPPVALAPLTGAEVTADPADPATDITIVLGIRADASSGALQMRGVWLDYEAGGQRYRALLPWLLRVCIRPTDTACASQDPAEFSFPD